MDDFKREHIKQIAADWMPFVSTLAIIVLFQLTTRSRLLSPNNLRVLTNQIFTVLLISLAAIFVYAHGTMDISIGANIGCGMLLGTLAVNASNSILAGFLIIIVFCTAIGFLNGALQKFFPHLGFLPTLCMMFILRAIVTYAGNIQTFKIPNIYGVYDNTILKVIVLLVLAMVSFYLFNFTKTGKFQKAIGGNVVASEQLGINIAKYKTIAFTLTGFYTAIASFFLMVRARSVVAETGSGIEFDVMIALIFGGMPMSGGMKTRLSAAIFGAVIVTVLRNGLIMWGLSVGTVSLVRALIFMVLVSTNYTRSKGVLPR
jgi:ribose transport system permease protein